MVHGLQRLTQARHGKLPVVIPEGMTRPVVPIVAAKFATDTTLLLGTIFLCSTTGGNTRINQHCLTYLWQEFM
jgi:hypothetical protein